MKQRREKFNALFLPTCIIVLCLAGERFITYFTRDHSSSGELVFKFILLFWLVLWKIGQRLNRNCVTLLVFFPALTYGVLGNLQLYDLVPDYIDDENETRAELRVLLVWMILFFGNYNKFLVTIGVVLVLIPLYLLIILKIV